MAPVTLRVDAEKIPNGATVVTDPGGPTERRATILGKVQFPGPRRKTSFVTFTLVDLDGIGKVTVDAHDAIDVLVWDPVAA